VHRAAALCSRGGPPLTERLRERARHHAQKFPERPAHRGTRSVGFRPAGLLPRASTFSRRPWGAPPLRGRGDESWSPTLDTTPTRVGCWVAVAAACCAGVGGPRRRVAPGLRARRRGNLEPTRSCLCLADPGLVRVHPGCPNAPPATGDPGPRPEMNRDSRTAGAPARTVVLRTAPGGGGGPAGRPRHMPSTSQALRGIATSTWFSGAQGVRADRIRRGVRQRAVLERENAPWQGGGQHDRRRPTFPKAHAVPAAAVAVRGRPHPSTRRTAAGPRAGRSTRLRIGLRTNRAH